MTTIASNAIMPIVFWVCTLSKRIYLYFYFMFELQPSLQNDLIRIEPLKATDFETLYAVASDPLIWEQHPNPDRYKREVFETFFTGAMESGGAFLVYNNTNNEVIGS